LSVGSEGLILDKNSTVAEGIEMLNGRGNVTLSHTSVGGTVRLVNGHNNLHVAAANLTAGGLQVANTIGSVSVTDSVLKDGNVDKLDGSANFSNVTTHGLSFTLVSGNINLFEVVVEGEIALTDARGNVSVVLCDFTGDATNSHLRLNKASQAVLELNTFHGGDIVAGEIDNLVLRGNRQPGLTLSDNGLVTLKSNRFSDAILSANHGGLVISDNAFDVLACLANDPPPDVATDNVVGTASGQCTP